MLSTPKGTQVEKESWILLHKYSQRSNNKVNLVMNVETVDASVVEMNMNK